MRDTKKSGEVPPSSQEAPVVAHRTKCYIHGSENWLHTQVKHLREHAPFVLTDRTKNLNRLGWVPPHYDISALLLPVRVLDRAGLAVLGYRPVLRRQLRRLSADLIHAHFGPIGYNTLPLAQVCGLPLITTFYGYDLSRLPNEQPEWVDRYRTLFEQGDSFLTEGSHMKRRLVELGCPEEKVTVHHLGVEVDAIPYQPRTRSEDAPLRVLAAGRFVDKKGFPDAIRAFARFLGRGGAGDLTIVGGLRDAEKDRKARKRLRQLLHEQDIADAVTIRGFLPHEELIQVYLDHHVFLAPSVEASSGDTEGGAPVTLIEASATGMAIVGTRHCDIPEVVAHGETGLLAGERDTEALSKHLYRLYREPERLRAMGKAGRERVEREYNAARQGERLDALYRNALDVSS